MLTNNPKIKVPSKPVQDWTLEEIAEGVRKIDQSNPDPQQAQEWRNWLGAEYSFVGGQLTPILASKGKVWKELRKKTKTDKQADLEWETSEWGQKEKILKMRLKRIEKLSSALRTQLEMWNKETYNQY